MTLVPFDDRDGWIWWNGPLVPWRDARPHVLSHGLHYASAVFEGERAYNGNIFRLRDHTERLIASGRILGFSPLGTTVHLAIAAWPWPNDYGDDCMRGLRLAEAPWRCPSPQTAPTMAKCTSGYTIGSLSKRRAEDEGTATP